MLKSVEENHRMSEVALTPEEKSRGGRKRCKAQ